MSYGLEVRNASGALIFSESDRLTRGVFTTVVAAGASGSASLDGVTADNAIGFGVGRSTNLGDWPPDVVVGAGVVSWSGGHGCISDVYVMMYR